MVQTRIRARMMRALTKWRGDSYIASQTQALHSQHAFPGTSWRAHVDLMQRTVPNVEQLTILDYGCGPRGGLREMFGENVVPFDAYVPEYSRPPWDRRIDVVFSSDVFEHMTVRQIDQLIQHLRRARPIWIFLNISTRDAFKSLPNGANAHLTVRPAQWWLNHLAAGLGADYKAVLAQNDLLRQEVTLCFQGTWNSASMPACEQGCEATQCGTVDSR